MFIKYTSYSDYQIDTRLQFCIFSKGNVQKYLYHMAFYLLTVNLQNKCNTGCMESPNIYTTRPGHRIPSFQIQL